MLEPHAPLGLARGHVHLTAHDPRWSALFREEERRLSASVSRGALPSLVIEHVGSTAVAGLVAKPILDILAGHPLDLDANVYCRWLAALGHEARGEQGVPGRELLVLGPASARTHHLHLVALDSRLWHDPLAFRDRLRAEPELASAYGALKLDLAARHAGDRNAYTARKAPFIVAASSSPATGSTG